MTTAIKRFHVRKILVAYDFSETAESALKYAVVLARRCTAEIHLLHVIESFSLTSAISHAFSKSQKEFEEKVGEKAEERLHELARKTASECFRPVHAVVEKGRIPKTVETVAGRIDADLVLAGAHGYSGVKEHLVGSHTSKIVMDSPCPVIVVRPSAGQPDIRNILLPIDHSPVSRQKVRYAVELARQFGSKVHVIGATTLTDSDLVRKFELKVHQVGDFLDEHGVQNTVRVQKGESLSQIALDHVRETGADLVVIMSEQEGSGLFLGNAALHIINHADIPVMAIHPDRGNPDTISVGY
ncbi:MAG: hypothetical protein RL213_2178 [Bacteroidota bacterium]|jgi:nucleotide-binding universal stress UspA family protein